MKGKILGLFLTVLVCALLFFCNIGKEYASNPKEVNQVYLNGDKIGLIKSKDKF